MIQAAGLILHFFYAVIVGRGYQKELWRSRLRLGFSPYAASQQTKSYGNPIIEAVAGIFTERMEQQSGFVREFDAQFETCLQVEPQK
jgi:hypothetical protein